LHLVNQFNRNNQQTVDFNRIKLSFADKVLRQINDYQTNLGCLKIDKATGHKFVKRERDFPSEVN